MLLPTGDRLQIPTGAETLRLKSYLIMCRNSTRDFTEFADLIDSMETQTAAEVLARMDRYYSGQRSRRQWVPRSWYAVWPIPTRRMRTTSPQRRTPTRAPNGRE